MRHNDAVNTRKTLALLTLPLLLTACPGPNLPPDDDVPTVARPAKIGAGVTCDLTNAFKAIGGIQNLRTVNHMPRLKSQAIVTPSVYDLLYGIRVNVNGNYWGVNSSIDLQALHDQYETKARSAFGNLKEAALNDTVDNMMYDYLDAIQDGHTYYLNAIQMAAFNSAQTGGSTPTPRFGISYAPVPQENGALILDVTYNSPAWNAGLQRGDTILSVNSTPLNRDATKSDSENRDVYSAVLKNAASTGTAVQMVIRRVAQNLSVPVIPAMIKSAEEPYGKFLNATTYLLRVPSFEATTTSTSYTSITAQKVHDLIHQAQAGGAQKIVLDMRDNPGGLVFEALAVAGAFTGSTDAMTLEAIDGNISLKYKNGQVVGGDNCALDQKTSLNIVKPATWTGKTVVLTNADSASGGEIVAQMLQLAGTAVYGEATYGISNTTTYLFDLDGGRGVAVTSSLSRNAKGQYFAPKTTPNVAVADNLQHLAHGTDDILQAALNAP